MKNKVKSYLVWIAMILALTVGCVHLLSSYFEKIIVEQEMSKMIIIAENNMSNIKYYFDSKMEQMNILFEEKAIDFNRAEEIAKNHSINHETILVFNQEESHQKKAFIHSWNYTGEDYILKIQKPMEGYIAEMNIELSYVYQQYLDPVQLGENGYCALKDENGILIMHPARSQIGMDSLQGRLEQYPGLNTKDTSTLVYNQYSKDSGCDIVTSYRWDRPQDGKVKKLISYASIYIDGHRFVGTNVMEYAEVVKPIQQLLFYTSILAGVIAFCFCLLVFFWQCEKRKMEKMEMMLQFTEEFTRMNQKFETQEMQIQKYDKLQTLGVMTSSVAHEFNNLLTPALLYSELLENEIISKQGKETLELLQKSIVHCGEFSNQLKDYAKQDVVDETLEIIDLKLALEGNLSFVKHLIPKRLTLKQQLIEETCWIEGNRRALSQILINLFNNAFQAIEGKGEILLTLKKENHYAILTIEDTGAGMDEETLRKIYTPFFTTKTENEGTGLGLTVVERLVKIQHGFIHCESELGKGTKFMIYFPLIKS